MKTTRRSISPETAGFKDRVAEWARRVRVSPKQVRVQRMRRKWASCSPRGWLTFSTDLLDEPRSFQDYVIVHELIHLKVPNHGKLFRGLLSAHLPSWRRVGCGLEVEAR